ncbi:MAG: retroviral-like aspartic protease family protein [Chloroflexi bacterium]|nr:retroviral-like aspartic protease family protein [Chloroflexota bacterium]
MWAYDQSIHPPALFVDTLVSRPISAALSRPLRAQLDTAADISCIPADLVDQLGLLPTSTILAQGYDGVQTVVDIYLVTLEVAGARFRYLEVVPIPEQYALLGRDVLNRFYAQLNGPDLTFHLSTSP